MSRSLTSNKISVNHSESNFTIFSYHKNFQLPPTKLGNDFLSETDSTKFLGVFLDNHLTLHDHIDLICSKLAKTNGVFYSLDNFFPSEQLKNIY